MTISTFSKLPYSLSALVLALCAPVAAYAQSNEQQSGQANAAEMERVLVESRRSNMLGDAVSASQGIVNQQEISIRPLLRTGEVLELVPGMVVTQHSGTGKANQYFLRGFNLDHGTDFATFVDGMPVNMRTHGHGQGYTDLNFIIPESIASLAYNKGSYYSNVGDFSGAGSASFFTARRQSQGNAELSLGQDNFQRLVVTNSSAAGSGDLYYAAELNRYDGPWTDIEEDLNKVNGLLRYTQKLAGGELSVSVMAYDNEWNSADQIPLRAVTSGIIDELGSLDDTVGGNSSRYSFNTQWQDDNWSINAYMISYDLNLWSNFTYFLDNEDTGDQFEQVDERKIYGLNASYQFVNNHSVNKFGVQYRADDIDEVGLYRTAQRQRIGAIRSDNVEQFSLGIFWDNEINWSQSLRSQTGLRYDFYDFDVASLIGENVNGIDLSGNVGTQDDDLISLKGSLIYALSEQWEAYVSAGQGFHSNDARGTFNQLDPTDGSQTTPVDPLVRSLGYEIGLRGNITEQVNTSIAMWTLTLDSELLFVGDAGNTEASRESRRSGLELTTYYRLDEVWTLDLEYSYSDAEFTDASGDGDNIPGAIKHVLQAGASAQWQNGWFANGRVRYFGERPLIEDGSVSSDPSTVVNLRLGYAFDNLVIKADILNLLDSNDHDIDYFYPSRLASEPSGQEVEDIHYHVLEPRTIRVSFSVLF